LLSFFLKEHKYTCCRLLFGLTKNKKRKTVQSNRFCFLIQSQTVEDNSNEDFSGNEPNCTSNNSSSVGNHKVVAEIQNDRPNIADVQNSEEVVGAVQEDPHTVRSTGVECGPPPVMVHTDKTNVRQEDGCLSDNDHDEDEGDEQETEDVVDVSLPDATEDERILDEGSTEGEDTRQDTHDKVGHEPGLRGNGAGHETDLLHQVRFDQLRAVGSGTTDEDQGDRDTEPQAHEDEHGGEGGGGGGLGAPVDEVEEEVHDEERTGEEEADGEDDLPGLDLELLGEIARDVATDGAEENKEEDKGGQEGATALGGNEADAGEGDGEASEGEELHTRTNEDGEETTLSGLRKTSAWRCFQPVSPRSSSRASGSLN